MIIDSHIHFGNSAWGNYSPEEVLAILGENIDYAICSNLEGIDSPEFKKEFECNSAMLNIAQKYSKIKPLYVCQPNQDVEIKDVRDFLIKNSEFVGLKFHPECMKLPADNVKYDKYLHLAEELNLPCLYHSGHIKSRFSSPKLIYRKAQEFPNVSFVLGHLSTGPRESHLEAIDILLESIETSSATLYVDVSWLDFAYEKLNETYEETLYLINALKYTAKGDYTHRILWASDAPVGRFNQSPESYLKNLRIFQEKVLEKFNDKMLLNNLLFNNAKRLYGIEF